MNGNSPSMKSPLTTLTTLILYSLTQLHAAEPITNSIGMRLVRIEAGSFAMGQDGPQTDYKMKNHPGESDRPDWDEKPVHRVLISKPFYIGATELTVDQYRQFDPAYRLGKGCPMKPRAGSDGTRRSSSARGYQKRKERPIASRPRQSGSMHAAPGRQRFLILETNSRTASFPGLPGMGTQACFLGASISQTTKHRRNIHL